ncbi:hypothetical protein FY034_06830 [Trichlorobacter lovleyi]|uniref:hypothetical protein n=1 Tax=Trichlorobacter lovleyi TaxID=313985 RepID=UPI0022404F18|nr:hypothetical protein [Trichlorobacter lovleyi]QOX78649.1 hypothetical protein FY034_06830 [Trichlorobacter lovleyi]
MVRVILQNKPVVGHQARAVTDTVDLHGFRSADSFESLLRRPRSQQYRKALARLDAGNHLHDPVAYQAFQLAIREEFPGIGLDDLPLLGIVARCNLGRPFEVHTLDLSGQIITHFRNWESLPPLLERARSLALHPAYAFVEVYTDRLVAVSSDGETAVI